MSKPDNSTDNRVQGRIKRHHATTDKLPPLAVENADLRARLEQAEKRVRGWLQAYEAAERQRDEARGLLREWLLWSRDHFIRGTAGMEDRTDAHLRDTGD